MDRVNLPNEEPGSATYYLMGNPEEFGTKIYNMERYDGALIRSVLMDIGSNRTEPHFEIRSPGEFRGIVNDSSGKTIYSCSFDLKYKGLDILLALDFQARRLTVKVDPAINLEQKNGWQSLWIYYMNLTIMRPGKLRKLKKKAKWRRYSRSLPVQA